MFESTSQPFPPLVLANYSEDLNVAVECQSPCQCIQHEKLLLFCTALNELVRKMTSKLTVWFLDDSSLVVYLQDVK